MILRYPSREISSVSNFISAGQGQEEQGRSVTLDDFDASDCLVDVDQEAFVKAEQPNRSEGVERILATFDGQKDSEAIHAFATFELLYDDFYLLSDCRVIWRSFVMHVY